MELGSGLAKENDTCEYTCKFRSRKMLINVGWTFDAKDAEVAVQKSGRGQRILHESKWP